MQQTLPDPFAPFLGMTAALTGLEPIERIRRGAWVHAHTPRPPVGLTPHEVVHRQGKLRLRYYAPRGGPRTADGGGTCAPSATPVSEGRPDTRRPAAPVPPEPAVGDRDRPPSTVHRPPDLLPIILVPSLINRAYILDLEPGRSLVEHLCGQGHPVYLVDWGIPGDEDADQDVGYVLLGLLHRSVRRACRHAGARQAVIFGYCMGGTLAAMYAALRPRHVASLVLLNAPFRFAEGGRFRQLTERVDVDAVIADDGLLPVAVMQPAFKMLDPMGNWSKFHGIEAAAADPVRLARVLARERWLEENVPMAGAFAREFLRRAYQDDALLDGTWHVRGERVDLGRITCPVKVVISERDFITPPAAAAPVADAVGSRTVEVERLDTGHIGVVVGSMGPRAFYPLLDDWCRRTAAGVLP